MVKPHAVSNFVQKIFGTYIGKRLTENNDYVEHDDDDNDDDAAVDDDEEEALSASIAE